MEGASALLEVVIKAKDEASAKLKEIGDQVEKNTKKTLDWSAAFKIAGGIVTGAGVAGAGAIKMFTDAAEEHQTAMASVDATLKNVSDTTTTHTQIVQGNALSVKANKAVIDDHIRTLKEQKLQYETMGGKHKDEISKIDEEIKAQELLKLKADDVVVSKKQTITVMDQSVGSYAMLKKTAEDLGDAYVKLGFNDSQTQTAFAQDVRVTKNVTDAKTMLAAAADLARLKHISLQDATTSLTMGYEGQTRVLKQLGIELPKGAKGMDVVNAAQQAAAGQAKAYANTQQGANDRLNASFDQFKVAIGDRLLPAITKLTQYLANIVDWFNKLSPTTKDIIAKVLLFGTAFALIAGPILLFIGFLPVIGAGIALLVSPIGLVILAIIALTALIGVAVYQIMNDWQHWQAVGKTVFAAIGTFFTNLGTTVRGISSQIVNDVKNMVNGVIDHINGLIHGINTVGSKIGLGAIKLPDIPKFENGGYVPNTGLAIVHQGEFVLSKDMLSGKKGVPSNISSTTNNNTPVNIYATINNDMDLNLLGHKLAFAVRNSR